MNTSAKILIVDDDPLIIRLLEMVLQAHYQVYSTSSGESVPKLIQELQPSLIIVDIQLPDMNGIDLIGVIRTYTQAPIMMVSGKNTDLEKISSFNSGADDYVVKPFSVAELTARVQAILRRFHSTIQIQNGQEAAAAAASEPVQELDIRLSVDQHRVFIGSTELSLTQKEFHFLKLLLNEKGKVLSREIILDKVWGINNFDIETRAVDACASRLRKKVKNILGRDVIEAVPGIGYRLIM